MLAPPVSRRANAASCPLLRVFPSSPPWLGRSEPTERTTRLGCSEPTVSLRRGRFAEYGVAGLADAVAPAQTPRRLGRPQRGCRSTPPTAKC